MTVKTLRDLYVLTRDGLRTGGIENADRVARDFLKRTMDISDIDILTNPDREIYSGIIGEMNEYLKRHISGEPVSRIFSEREFWGIPFRITPDVLDPRPDTETIVEVALRRFSVDSPVDILDLGTGSGCIITALMTEWPHARGVASDISERRWPLPGKTRTGPAWGTGLPSCRAIGAIQLRRSLT